MGGGVTYTFGISSSDEKRLANTAKKILQDGESPQRRNVFISFASEDLDKVRLLRGQAKNEDTDLEFIDNSLRAPVNSEDEEYIKKKIRERIKRCSVTVVYVSEETHKSKWVNWEIEQSIKQGKGVVAVHQGDTPPKTLPNAIKDNGIEVRRWNQKELTDAIERTAQDQGY